MNVNAKSDGSVAFKPTDRKALFFNGHIARRMKAFPKVDWKQVAEQPIRDVLERLEHKTEL